MRLISAGSLVRAQPGPASASSAAKSGGCHAGVKRRRAWCIQLFVGARRLRLGRPANKIMRQQRTQAVYSASPCRLEILALACAGFIRCLAHPRMSSFVYVYIIVSDLDETIHSTGVTRHLSARLKEHNRGACAFTAKNRPWRIETSVAFRSALKARAFESYLKSGSGREFARRHF